MCNVVEDGSVSYKLEGSCLSLIYEGKVDFSYNVFGLNRYGWIQGF